MTMLLSQLVEVNQKGIVANAVNIGMMDDPQMNLLLCEGFIFNYDVRKPESSTVGILDAIRRSYHSRNESNIHLMIQQYGKGKSHFAVAIANFFKQPFNSPEVQGILDQVEVATSSKNKAIAQGLKLFKQNQQHQHLVICLSGDRGGDIRKQFLQVLIKSLEEVGIEDSIARHICGEPLRYLESLNEPQRIRADEYLQSIGNPDGDLNCLVRLLKENNPAVIPTVKNLAYHLTSFNLDFSSHIDIEAILQDLINNYCTGENARFQGILILFDELNYYLQSWAADQIGAGGTALQNITNICESYKGKIALLSFTQIDPVKAVGISATAQQSYLKISSRLAPKDSTYNPASSLELVLDNLLIQKEKHSSWGDFFSRWQDTLIAEARIAYERRIKIYRENGWELEDFYRHLSKGCFPLHPLTAYLLCNLDFTQDRTAIQFIKSYVKNFIQDEPVEKVGQLNYIYPIALVDTFIENFSNYPVYQQYKQALALVAGSEDPDELLVLKALFLFHACSEKLTKSDREEHQEVIASLTGLPKIRLNAVLDKLEKTRDIIHYRPEAKLYRFWERETPTEIEKEIEDKIKDTPTSVHTVIVHCQTHIQEYLGDETITATQFVKDNKLIGADWQYEYKIYSIDGFIKALESEQTLRNLQRRGILAYVLAETQEELQDFRRNVDNYLSRSPIKNRIAVAISSEETGDLDRVLLMIKTLEEKDALEKQLFGAAYKQLLQRWQEQVDTQLERLLKSCTYHCVVLDKIPSTEQGKAQRIISALLQEEYRFVPPVEEIDKMRSDHQTGSKIIGFVSKQLFTESLTPQTLPPDKAYITVIDTIFVIRWGLLRKASQQYILQEPTHEKILDAWKRISDLTKLEGLPEKIVDLEKIWRTFSAPPYGYSEYNFTILLAGWLAYHRKEVYLRGAISLNAKGNVSVQTLSLKDWASTDILHKPKDFVNIWIVKGKSKLIRRQKAEMPVLPKSPIAYDQAQQYLEAVATFLESNEPDSLETNEVTRNRELVSAGVEQINNWFQPVEEADALPNRANLETLLQLYPKLLQSPPANAFRSDVISVRPTQQQRDRQNQALQAINQKIAELVKAESQRAKSLQTEEACNAYKVEIQGIIDQMTPVTDLPPHLTDALQDAVRAASLKLTEIREQTRVRECLARIQSVNRSLDDNSTQQDYTNSRVEIETLARSIADGTQEAAEVQQIVQSIDQRHKELTQQIAIWEERSSGVTARNHVLELFEEISRQYRRFTEEASKQKIAALQEQLKQELLTIQSRDDTEKLVRAELFSLQQKLQRIRDLSLNKLSEAFQVYQELIKSSFSFTEQTINLEKYQKNLDDLKIHGRTAISEKFASIYNSKPNCLEDCDSLQEKLQRSQIILEETEDFVEIKEKIKQTLANLEVKRQEIRLQIEEQQKQAEDERIMLDIRKYATDIKLNTIYLCEEAIKEIDELKKKLNYSTQFTTDIDQIIQSIQNKLNDYYQRWIALRDRVTTVDDLTGLSHISSEYAKLEFVLQDSANYQQYQEIQQQIQYLKDDLEQIKNLETRYQQSNSIASCNDLLETIASQQIVLHYSDRFRNKIHTLEENIDRKIQNYTSELREFEYNLEHISTVKEAQRLYEELAKKSGQFLNSDVEEQYQSINNELKLLIELLQLVESVRINTLESCQAQLNRIRHWQNITENLTSRLRDRLQSIYEELEQNKLQLLQQEQTAAQEWLKELSERYTQIHQLLNDADKFEAANQILQQIVAEKSLYVEFLNQKDLQSLEKIERQCIEEQGRNKANQILQLFRQLPRVQRQNLYERLAQYLLDSTEGGNG